MKISIVELEQAARSLDVKVTYEDLKTSKGGSCRVMETRRIIINKHLPVNEKINLWPGSSAGSTSPAWTFPTGCGRRSCTSRTGRQNP